MKKKVLLSAVCLALALGSASYAKSGVFVGANAGLAITTPSYLNELKDNKSMLPDTGVGYVLGLDAGYQQNFTPKMGLRYYLSYNFSQSFASKTNAISLSNGVEGTSGSTKATQTFETINFNHLVAANVDFFYNVTDMFGAYVGLGAGFSNFSIDMKSTILVPGEGSDSQTIKFAGNSFALPLNVGVSMNLGEHQVVKLGAKIPLLGTDIKASDKNAFGSDKAQATLRNYIIQVGYSYMF
ncbi:outer membrane beta-barrel protein [Helicobacter sp. 11S02629-2]|uniref:outer membrane beta-barrel protein n=1 Tax=Helicobacter sp. 11S02629-2 TaxID=1476195 RepID=UPI000BA7A4BF|nr:outer membrane beta-barrel protein [Helicobacter sp. 11S02629-2]PAF45271.1 hypothetical protein BKH40_03480 [Helicobacter sp. 11S02629-2]